MSLAARSVRAAGYLAAGATAVFWLGCSRPVPVVQQHATRAPHNAMRLVAVMPFYPRSDFDAAMARVDPITAGELVGRFVTEAVADRGIPVVPAIDLIRAFEAQGRVAPRLDGRAAARISAEKFGATSVLVGEVWRYRERSGEALGTSRPASVAFEVTLFAAPDGRRIWQARFDETQQPLTANPLRVGRLPGGGTRWLTAAELARWGAKQVAESMPRVP